MGIKDIPVKIVELTNALTCIKNIKMAEELKEGDVVQLKSGSHKLTIGFIQPKNIHGLKALCYWKEGNDIKSMLIDTVALTTELDQAPGITIS